MYIKFVEIQNFRKLKSIRIDFSDKTTVFVGANNSGKTSAMDALGYFLIDNCFTLNDFTISNWQKINEIGARWEQSVPTSENIDFSEWDNILPSLDVWLHIDENEIHYVSHLLPTLDWTGELLGVRLRCEPKDFQKFFKEYILARDSAKITIEAAKIANQKSGDDYTVSLWPISMEEFLDKRLNALFAVHAYILDFSKCTVPQEIAYPQSLPIGSEPLEGNPFNGLIRIDKIDAHRGFSNLSPKNNEDDNETSYKSKGKLSEQLHAYYEKHLDPSVMPDPSDVEALEAIYKAQRQFDEKLKTSFQNKFDELKDLGYPGITDPNLDISTKIKPVDGLNHSSALKYRITSHDNKPTTNAFFLPEQYNGLGYQNLISMVFRLMSFRDKWMLVGKAGKKAATDANDSSIIPPLHLVLIEEPEAHLHAQVQQVFIRKAYEILRKHENLGTNTNLATQLVISTHSSHIAHECEFSWLRYFQRHPAINTGEVPTATVVNLSEVFGDGANTEQFVTRYIKTTHCDLFFADAVILVEGPAERMLIPHFIRKYFQELNQSYITLLEIGGSHAHRLRSLIEHLGLITLIITDLDAAESTGNISKKPTRNINLITRNSTLKTWLPEERLIDDLLDMSSDKKIMGSVRVAYQCPVEMKFHQNNDSTSSEILSNTFEDALVFENLNIFKKLDGTGLINKFKTAINSYRSPEKIGEAIFEALKTGDKAEFALDLLYSIELENLIVPTYINEGLNWLNEKIKNKQKEILSQDTALPLTEPV